MDWHPRYPALWRAKTRHLDPFQDGCYLRLCDEYMETRQPLPDNDAALARIIGISLEQWQASACGIVRAFFKPQNGLLFHDRCDQILAEQDARERKQSEKSKKGAEARWKKIKGIDATGRPQAMPNHATGQDTTLKEAAEEKTSEEAFPNDLIEAFEDSVCEVWGDNFRRLCPTGKDRMVAGEWIEHGITPDFCRDYFVREMSGMKDRGKDPPKGLSFFNSTIAPAFAKNQESTKFEKTKTESERKADYYRKTGKWLSHWGTMPEGLKNVS